MLTGKTTLKELLRGANRDAQIMSEKTKSKRHSINIHHMEIVLQGNKISPRPFLHTTTEEILFYMTRISLLKQETVWSTLTPCGTTSTGWGEVGPEISIFL